MFRKTVIELKIEKFQENVKYVRAQDVDYTHDK